MTIEEKLKLLGFRPADVEFINTRLADLSYDRGFMPEVWDMSGCLTLNVDAILRHIILNNLPELSGRTKDDVLIQPTKFTEPFKTVFDPSATATVKAKDTPTVYVDLEDFMRKHLAPTFTEYPTPTLMCETKNDTAITQVIEPQLEQSIEDPINLRDAAEESVLENLRNMGVKNFAEIKIYQYTYTGTGEVLESQKLPKPVNRIYPPSHWEIELRQDIPVDEHAVHDYYAAHGMRRWRYNENGMTIVAYWSPIPADWANADDELIKPPEPVASFCVVSVAENDDANGPPLNNVHVVFAIPEDDAEHNFISWSGKVNYIKKKGKKAVSTPEKTAIDPVARAFRHAVQRLS